MKTKSLQIATREIKQKSHRLPGPGCKERGPASSGTQRHMSFSVLQEDVTPTIICAFLSDIVNKHLIKEIIRYVNSTDGHSFTTAIVEVRAFISIALESGSNSIPLRRTTAPMLL
ncbi:hypothetical protein PoB_000698600 [Plakobranchus ocellatus]|uniref:Uncharacterized protein n=1 Tax=Plakobranchus ocellatus TaxID=259542 RepID=A0AAV3XZU0_9GAST|nr:hypothetical protein PoB_000698600 [Plakobranchus ocellatus]